MGSSLAVRGRVDGQELEVWRSPRARMACSAAARNIYIDEPTPSRSNEAPRYRLKAKPEPTFAAFVPKAESASEIRRASRGRCFLH